MSESLMLRELVRYALSEECGVCAQACDLNDHNLQHRVEGFAPHLILMDAFRSSSNSNENSNEAESSHTLRVVSDAKSATSRPTPQEHRVVVPAWNIDMPGAIAAVRAQVLPHLSAVQPGKELPFAPRALSSAAAESLECIAIGISTGGPDALAQLLPTLPANFPVPIFVVQHMPMGFTSYLAESLSKVCSLRVKEAENGEIAQPGTVYIAPSGTHMKVHLSSDGLELSLTYEDRENFYRPSVDVLFRSIAHACGPRTLVVMMTGMGQDGLEGSRAIVNAGGRVLAQDQRSSVVWGMPGSVVNAKLASKVLPLGQISAELQSAVFTPPAVAA